MNVQAILSRKGTAVATVQPDATLAQATASLAITESVHWW